MANGGMLGGITSFLKVDIEIPGMKKFKQLRQELMGTEKAANNANTGMNRMGKSTQKAGSAANDTNEAFGKMFGLGMNVMFLGMALSQVFGSLAGSMMKMFGVTDTFGAAAKSVLMPFFSQVAPLANDLAMALMKLPKPIKTIIGALVGLLAVLGPVLFFGAQLFLLTTQLSISFGTLLLTIGALVLTFAAVGLAIIALNRIFKKFGPVVGMLATIIGGVLLAALSPIGAVILTIFGAFKAVNKIFKKFGKIAGVVAAIIVGVIAVIIGIFASVPVAVGLAIGAVIALIWNLKDEIVGTIKGIANFIAGIGRTIWQGLVNGAEWLYNKLVGNSIIVDLVNDIKKWIGKLIDFFSKLPSKIVSAVAGIADKMLQIGKDIVGGIVDGITSMGSAVKDAIFGLMPEKLTGALEKATGAGGDVLSTVSNILTPNDFILTSGGKMIKPHKNDTIIGTKKPGQLGGGGGGQVTVNINDPVMKEDVDVQRVVDEVEDRVNRDARGRSGLGT